MITYTYIVKCPECDDEFFDFFDEAKEFALGCVSKKPIITQTEVNRNDFGECTDHCDLGTVWSWEDVMKETDAEPTISVFTKDDLKCMTDGKDPEFDTIDNSVDFEPVTSEISSVDEVPVSIRKPIPEGMTIEQLVEEMEENEDTVECTWCEELFDKSECRYEVGAGGPDDGLGWLCSRCEMAIKSRGETLTFRENNYWDFLDEDLKPITWICEFDGKEVGTVEATTEEEAYLEMERRYPDLPYGLYDGVAIVYPEDDDELTEASLSDIAAAANSEFGSSWNSEDILDMSGVEDDFRHTDIHAGMTPSEKVKYEREREEEKAYKAKLARWKKYQKSKQEGLDPETLHDLGNEYDGGYPTEKPVLPEIDEVSDSHLKLCPECGKNAFDTETGICVDCGFN